MEDGADKEITIDELEDTRRLKIIKPDERALVGPNAVSDNPALKNEYYLSVNSKAGLNNIDHQRVHKVIQDASKHSEFFKSEEEKLDAVRDKV